jgi:hypothetical protein
LFSSATEGLHSGESIMRALLLFCVALMATESFGYAQDQTLRGVYGPPGAAPPAKSGKATAAPDYGGAIGNGPRVTISGSATRGRTLPNGVSPAPIADRPGYGTAIVNGHRTIVDLNNNRIVQVMD